MPQNGIRMVQRYMLLGRGWANGVIAKGCRVSFWGDENILKLVVVMAAQLERKN